MVDRPAPLANPPQGGPAAPLARAATRMPRCVSSEQLFGGTTEVQIDHRGVLYRLRQTALGKLILTK